MVADETVEKKPDDPQNGDPNKKIVKFTRTKKRIKDLKNGTLIRKVIFRLHMNPNCSNLWFSLGILLSEEEEYEFANEAFNRVASINPNYKKLWNAKALVLSKMGKTNEASECFKRSLETFKGKLVGYNDLTELQKEMTQRRDQLGLEQFDDASIQYLTANILDIDSFIQELEMPIIRGSDGIMDEILGNISLKLDELEELSRPKEKGLFGFFKTKKGHAS